MEDKTAPWQRQKNWLQKAKAKNLPMNGGEHLWEMLKLALTNEDEHGDLTERSNMLNFYEHAKELIKNIFTLLEEKIKAGSKKDFFIV